MNSVIRVQVLMLAAVLLVGCENLAKIAPEPAAKYEPRSRGGNKSPYTVFGQTYTVLDTAGGYKESGIASWYGKPFHGRQTANGERYNMYRVSAAHKSLPIPTYVKVTNHENGKTLVVRVNDRGPFHEDRIIDLSYAAALKLGFAEQGVTQVTVEALAINIKPDEKPLVTPPASKVLEPISPPVIAAVERPLASTAPENSSPNPVARSIKRYLQVGVFSEQAQADKIVNQLAEFVAQPVFSKPAIASGKHRVVVGPIETDNDLEKVSALLLFHGVEAVFTVYDFD